MNSYPNLKKRVAPYEPLLSGILITITAFVLTNWMGLSGKSRNIFCIAIGILGFAFGNFMRREPTELNMKQ